MHRGSAVLPAFIFLTACIWILLRFPAGTYSPSQPLPQYEVDDFEVESYTITAEEDDIPEEAREELLSDILEEHESSLAFTAAPASLSSAATTVSLQKIRVTTTSTANVPGPTEKLDWDELQDKIYDYVQWDRPVGDHWPAWQDYDGADYDPNRWEGMDRENGYYVKNTVSQLERTGAKPETYMPYPKYNSDEWREKWMGNYMPCPGPRGQSYAESLDHVVRAYPSSQENFPKASIGSASVLGLDESVCFDRHSRYGPYGFANDAETATSKKYSHKWKRLDWTYTGWGRLQDACFEMNNDRYAPDARIPMVLNPSRTERRGIQQFPFKTSSEPLDIPQYHKRTAVLIRTWEGYNYQENDLQALRALITELSLLSGGEYQVYLLVNVKQREANIYDDPLVYQDILKKTVPAEFRDIAVLWTERVLEDWYPKVGDWQVYWMQFMPLQWFSRTHPEFDYIWNWETDARYVGNHYHFLEQISAFAKSMPRKHLWERNTRFYIPQQHGSWDAFLNDTDAEILRAKSEGGATPVWGPQTYAPYQTALGPRPPRAQEEDDFQWGVGEEADLITLQPIWDPAETGWSYRNHIWNFIPTIRPQFTPSNPNGDGINHPGFSTIPRRVFINTQVRLSKRLLNAMHEENLQGRSMQAEMWPATVALQHGLKAVYAPHPIWTDRKWPAWYMDAVFNANNNETARWGQQEDSPYNHDREANFGGWSWYFRSVFPHVLYRRWLGWKSHDWGWDAEIAREEEWDAAVLSGAWNGDILDGSTDGLKRKRELGKRMAQKRDDRVDVAGRMCLPGMLLHPVKNVREDADLG